MDKTYPTTKSGVRLHLGDVVADWDARRFGVITSEPLLGAQNVMVRWEHDAGDVPAWASQLMTESEGRLLCHPSRDRPRTISLVSSLAIAEVALLFGEVDRATQHQDGRPESDTTHTVMLCLVVPPLATAEGLDPGLAVQFAVVHDLVEYKAGDTNTAFGLDAQAQESKKAREEQALVSLRAKIGKDAWACSMIDRYEAQLEPEARLVRYADKITPKLTHILNRGVALRAIGMSLCELVDKHEAQAQELHTRYPELRVTRQLFLDACARTEEMYKEVMSS